MRAALRRTGLWLAGASAVLCGLFAALWALAGRGFVSQDAAARWQREQPFSQISVFFSADAAVNDESVAAMRSQIGQILAAANMAPENGGPAWTDGYCAETGFTAVTEANSRPARAICTGGDYFAFHPLEMVSGWYYREDELDDTLVVLDEPLAWQLFGSSDVAGMTVELDGWPCTVAGVAHAPRQADESDAYGDTGTVYMSYSLCCRLRPEVPVTCYEALLPEAVGGFALQTVTGAVTAAESERQIIQNTGRFTLHRSLAGLRQLPRLVQRTDRVSYPFWENAARAAQARACLFAAAAVAAALWPCLYGAYWAARGLSAGVHRLKETVRRKRG